MFSSLPAQLFLSALFGALIGLERQSITREEETETVSGIRTYSLLGLLGGIAGVLYQTQVDAIFFILSATIGLMMVAYYVVGSLITKRFGVTSEMSMIFTFIIGFLVVSNSIPLEILVALVIVVLLILSLKSRTRVLRGVSHTEVQSLIAYGIIALVVFPLLPNIAYTLGDIPGFSTILSAYHIELGAFTALDIVNPRKLWFIVVLVTGIDLLGYVLQKLVGHKKGVIVASTVGGFISSTSTTQALAQRSMKTFSVHPLVGAAILANMASFFQVFLLVAPLNSAWLVSLTPILLFLIFSCAITSTYFFSRKDNRKTAFSVEKSTGQKKIFSLSSALKFALLLTAVKLVTKACLILFGQSGFILSSILASFAGIDAVVITLAELAGTSITFEIAILTFLLVNATNLLSKSGYAFFQGKRTFSIPFTVSMLIVIGTSALGLLFVW